MLLSSKFLTESNGEKIVKIDQYLAKIWTKCNSSLFWPTLYVLVFDAFLLVQSAKAVGRNKAQF